MDAQIRCLDTTPIADIHACFLRAFSDYALPVDMSVRQFMLMLSRRGFDKSFSVGAFSQQRMVGCLLVGINGQSGYIISSGVIEEFRSRGLFTSMFKQLKQKMIEHRKQEVILEVLKENKAAVRLYRRLGFVVIRGLEFYAGVPEASAPVKPPARISLCGVEDLDMNLHQGFWEVSPSWQNSTEAMHAASSQLLCAKAEVGEACAGYACIDRLTGDVPQIAVKRDYRRQNIGTSLTISLLEASSASRLKIINIDSACTSLTSFCTTLGLARGGEQFEMKYRLGWSHDE
jgi:ribosomal protein S18 acetylase RimI-like enzyme